MKIEEINFTVPLDEPLETQALKTGAPDAPWRLVVFPGTPCRKELFYRFLRVAPDNLEVIVMARPGFGKGHRAPILAFSDQASAARPFLGEKKTIVLGVSYGGALALTTALENPAQVQGVVTVAMLVTEPFDYARMLADATGHPWVRPLTPNRLHIVRAEVEGRRAQIGPLLDRLPELKAPVEVVHGDFDTLVPFKDAEKLHARLGGETGFDKAPGGTHYLEVQYPRRLYEAVARVIKRAEAAA